MNVKAATVAVIAASTLGLSVFGTAFAVPPSDTPEHSARCAAIQQAYQSDTNQAYMGLRDGIDEAALARSEQDQQQWHDEGCDAIYGQLSYVRAGGTGRFGRISQAPSAKVATR